jgi:hypothetical protein
MTESTKTKRFPREYFTERLKKIAENIAEHEQFSSQEKRYLENDLIETIFMVKKLWVYGSWSRGSAHCGDLDLLVEIKVIKGDQPRRGIKALKLKMPHISIGMGTPEGNSQNVALQDAQLIWSEDSPDWLSNIQAIKLDSGAGRMVRKYDSLPLGPQYFFEIPTETDCPYDALVDRKKEGIIEWETIDFSEIEVDQDRWSKQASDWLRFIGTTRIGKQSLASLRYLVGYLESQSLFWNFDTWYGESSNGIRTYLGPGDFPDWSLLNNLDVSELAIPAHQSKKGPNILWIIRRGPQHPLVKQIKGVKVWISLIDDQPNFVSVARDNSWKSAKLIECFLTRDDAEKTLVEKQEKEFIPVISEIQGSQLLRVLSRADIVELVHSDTIDQIAIKDTGKTVMEGDAGVDVDVTSPDELINKFKSAG